MNTRWAYEDRNRFTVTLKSRQARRSLLRRRARSFRESPRIRAGIGALSLQLTLGAPHIAPLSPWYR
jgi:hypothetical protein